MSVITTTSTPDEWEQMVDSVSTLYLGHGVDEFRCRWASGDYHWGHDHPRHCDIVKVAMMLPECW